LRCQLIRIDFSDRVSFSQPVLILASPGIFVYKLGRFGKAPVPISSWKAVERVKE
jgi:hypothetical protein